MPGWQHSISTILARSAFGLFLLLSLPQVDGTAAPGSCQFLQTSAVELIEEAPHSYKRLSLLVFSPQNTVSQFIIGQPCFCQPAGFYRYRLYLNRLIQPEWQATFSTAAFMAMAHLSHTYPSEDTAGIQ